METEYICFFFRNRAKKWYPSVIRTCLGLSANQLNRLIEAKAIFSPEGYPLKKHKVKDGDVVLVNKHIAGMF